MLVSTKGRYALQIMVDVAMNEEKGPVKIRDIADKHGLSVKYLEQIISSLAKGGCVRSVRGNQGGYYLTKPAAEYTVGSILRITEGSLAVVECLRGEENPCADQNECISLRLWREVGEAIDGVLDHYTLEDLVTWQMQIRQGHVV